MDNIFTLTIAHDELLTILEASKEFLLEIGKKDLGFSLIDIALNKDDLKKDFKEKIDWGIFSTVLYYIKNNEKRSIVIFTSFKYEKFFAHAISIDAVSDAYVNALKKQYKLITQQSRDMIFEYDILSDTMIYPSNSKPLFSTKPVVQNYKKYLNNPKSPIAKIDRERVIKFFDSIGDGDYSSIEFRLNVSGQKESSCRLEKNVVKAGDKLIKAIGRIYSIEEEKKEKKEITEKSIHDFITGTYNADAFISLVSLELMEKVPNIVNYALIIVDIDNFKLVNEQYGCNFGDDVLTNSAKKIKNFFGSKAIVGRTDCNQFQILIKIEDNYSILRTKAIQLNKLFRNYIIDEKNNKALTVSIGISRYPVDGKSYEELNVKALKALNIAKSAGKDNSYLYIDDKFESINLDVVNNKKEEDMIINNVYRNITKTSDLNSNVKETLDYLCSSLGFYSAAVYEKKDMKTSVSFTSTADETFIKDLYECYNIIGNGLLKRFNDDHVYVFSKENKDNLSIENQFYKRYKLGNSLSVYLETDFRFDLIITFFNLNNEKYTDKVINIIKMAASIIRQYIYKFRLNINLKNEVKKIEDTVDAKTTYNYIVDKNDFSLIDFDSNTSLIFNEAKRSKPCYKALMGNDVPCDKCPIVELRRTRVNTTDYYLRNKKIWVSSTAVDFELPNGKKAYLVHNVDTSKQMRRIAARDSLTGLLTISSFISKAEELVGYRKIDKYALVNFDIEKFKYINEMFGYSFGDKVLLSLTKTISNSITESEILIRVSGDEFILLLKCESEQSLIKRLENIRNKVLMIKYDLNRNVEVSIKGGICLFDFKTPISMSLVDLSNIARKIAKKRNENFIIYDDEIDLQELKKKEIEKIMRSALENNEFKVYIHPKVDIQNNVICGGEALIRWLHNGYLVSPGEFIPIFEENGFVVEIDNYVYEQIFKLIRYWMDNNIPLVTISMNVSFLHFKDPNFIPLLQSLIDKYEVDVKYIELELLESLLIDCSTSFYSIFNKLHEMGFTLSLDDFGSGYSSLNILKSLPIDVMKLDKGFFDLNNEKGRVIVEEIVSLANKLNIKPLAEGIENKEQIDFLKSVGCRYVQGFYFYKPMALIDFINLYKEQNNELE